MALGFLYGVLACMIWGFVYLVPEVLPGYPPALMAAGRFFVLKSCPKTSEALMAAVWDERSPTKDVRLDDGTMNIDSLDAMEYAYEREIGALVDRGVWR